MVVIGADEELQEHCKYEQRVDADDAVAQERPVAYLVLPGDDGKDKAADDHEEGYASVALVEERYQGVDRVQVALVGVEEVKHHHQTGRQEAQVVEAA